MFYLIHPSTTDHGSCASILADLSEVLATAVEHPSFGESEAQRNGACHLAMVLADGLRKLDELARAEREQAREEGYRRGQEARTVAAPDLTEPAPKAGKRQRSA